MKTSNLGMFAVAAAIALVGALWVGLPLATIVPLMIVVACPLMMIFLMKGMHGGGNDDERQGQDQRLHH